MSTTQLDSREPATAPLTLPQAIQMVRARAEDLRATSKALNDLRWWTRPGEEADWTLFRPLARAAAAAASTLSQIQDEVSEPADPDNPDSLALNGAWYGCDGSGSKGFHMQLNQDRVKLLSIAATAAAERLEVADLIGSPPDICARVAREIAEDLARWADHNEARISNA